jgi:hypothetical protein
MTPRESCEVVDVGWARDELSKSGHVPVLLCLHCLDVLRATTAERRCYCGACASRVPPGGKPVFSGPAMILDLDASDLSHAISAPAGLLTQTPVGVRPSKDASRVAVAEGDADEAEAEGVPG